MVLSNSTSAGVNDSKQQMTIISVRIDVMEICVLRGTVRSPFVMSLHSNHLCVPGKQLKFLAVEQVSSKLNSISSGVDPATRIEQKPLFSSLILSGT